MQHKIVEFFSGIGGWSCALSRLPPVLGEFKVVAAFDINTLANDVYTYNHKLRPSGKSLERVNAATLENLQANVWVMSPPCQPFTRNNTTEERDANDTRSRAFLYLIEQLQLMKRKPAYIALENVVGFESSVCCESFLKMLREMGYHYQQFHLDPLQFGIPNSRPRYYCTAWRMNSLTPEAVATTVTEESLARVYKSLPHLLHSVPPQPLSQYLDHSLDEAQLVSNP
jgi:tRNA (cytosine38-C5)-methyltransferase